MDVLEIIERIDFLKTQIDELRPISTEILNRINRKFRFDWDYHSSNIEGNSLTYGETKAFLLHGLTAGGKPFRDHLEIRGHNEAVFELEDIVKNEKQLSETIIKQLHQIVLGTEPYEIEAPTANGQMTRRTIQPGRYKSQPNHVLTITNELLEFSNPEDTAPKMQELVEWLKSELLKNELHPLILAVTLHHKFIMIHPFDDGNGRLARLLMNLVLMIKGFPPAIILTQDKGNYFRALRQADGGEIEGFIIYIGKQLIRSLELFLKGAYGENIEDLDEVDKKIALFKAKLKKPEGEIKHSKRSREAIVEITKNSIIPLIQAISEKLNQFNELFLEADISIRLKGEFVKDDFQYQLASSMDVSIEKLKTGVKNIVETGSNISEIIQHLNNIILKTKDLTILEITFFWKHFKSEVFNTYIEKQSLVINLEEFYYVVREGNNKNTFISKYYNSNLSEEDILSVANSLAENTLKKLQSKLS